MDLGARGVQRDRFDLDAHDLRSLQLLEHTIKYTGLGPAVHAGVDGVPVAEPFGQSAPLAAMLGYIEDRIDHLQITQADVATLTTDVTALLPIVQNELAAATKAGKKANVDVVALKASADTAAQTLTETKDSTNFADAKAKLTAAKTGLTDAQTALEAAGFKPEFGEVTMKPEGDSPLEGEDAVKMQKLLDALEGLDDVQEIYTTAVMDE